MNREYFIVRPDRDLRDVIQPLKLADAKDLKELDEYAPFFVARQDRQEYPDYLEKQPYPRNTCRFVSDKMKQILAKHSPATFFKSLVFIDNVQMRQEVYWLMEPPVCAAISPHSQVERPGLPSGRIRELVLEREKVGNEAIFTLSDTLAPYLIVSLRVAESMLRRDAWGIQFERVKVV
jgi:hypothetical protein